MKINYNRTGAGRKPLVAAIASITGTKARYLGAPSFAYQVGRFTIDRSSAVTFDDQANSEEVKNLIKQLRSMGFEAAPAEGAAPANTDSAECADLGTSARDGLTIQMPADSFTPETLVNLASLLTAKGRLIRKALGVEALPVEISPDTVSFPWFRGEVSGAEVKAYTHLITALCDMARKQKRIIARDKDTGNDKYAFRCFLLRLGFIGAEYKEERKILLRSLTGNGAFKSGG